MKNLVHADCCGHLYCVSDGQTFVGTINPLGGQYGAYDRAGVLLGKFVDLQSAARSIPRADGAAGLAGPERTIGY
jgi:hypothetical protein